MKCIPYGYQITNGQISVNEAEAEKIKLLFTAHFNGMSTVDAGRAAGLYLNPKQLRYILRNPIYIGDKAYPAIVDQEMLVVARKNKKRVPGKRVILATTYHYSDIPDADPDTNPADYVTMLYDRLVANDNSVDENAPAKANAVTHNTLVVTTSSLKTVENPEAATAASTPRRITVTLEDAIAAMNDMPNTVCNEMPNAVCSSARQKSASSSAISSTTVKRADAAAGRDVTSVPTVAHTHRSGSTVVSLSF